jgi:hypothetical protein
LLLSQIRLFLLLVLFCVLSSMLLVFFLNICSPHSPPSLSSSKLPQLIVCRWNSEKLLERYYENPEKVMKEAGVTASTPAKGPLRTSATNSMKTKPTECEICGDDLDSNNSCTLECLHVYVLFFHTRVMHLND